jgi:MOSC domain-containing protein YiiM
MWINKRCSGVHGKLQNVVGFQCVKIPGTMTTIKLRNCTFLGENLSLEGVDEICYLRDMNDRS